MPKLLLLLFFLSATALDNEKMTAEEVIARHLKALGKIGQKNRVISGACSFNLQMKSAGAATGLAVLASEGKKSLIGMAFNLQDYPQEKIGYDGKRIYVAYTLPGRRSFFGTFLLSNDLLMREGLMTGTLSTGWALLEQSERKAKIEYAGKKKIDGRELYILNYQPQSPSDVKIRLYFDTKSFYHVRSEYEQVIAAQLAATPELSSKQRETRIKMVEEFSEFQSEGGSLLPHHYRIVLRREGTNLGSEVEYNLILEKYSYDQDIDPTSFNVLNN